MSQLVFQANAGGQITFNGENTANGYSVTVPAANGTLVYSDGSGNVTFVNIDATGNVTIDGTLEVGGATSLTTFEATGDGTFSGTGEVKLPAGTVAERSGSPAVGMIRFNTDYDQFEGYDGTAWGIVGGGATGAGGNQVFVLNDQTVTASYTVPSGKNAMSAGEITIDTGVTVTVSTGSNWVIV